MKSKQRPRGHAGASPRDETVGQMQGRGTHMCKALRWQRKHDTALRNAEHDRDSGGEELGCGWHLVKSLVSEEITQFIIQTWTCSE